MKLKLIFGLAAMFVFSFAAFSQSVVITSKKTVYKRSKPVSDFRQTFTINYPKVKAATPVLSRKIESAIGYEKNFDLNLKEETDGEYQWLDEADFQVVYNKNGILSVDLFIEGTGAYPSGDRKTVVVDLDTGNPVKAAAVFTDFAGLVAKLKGIQNEKIKANFEERKDEPDFSDLRAEIEEELKDTDFTAGDLEAFSVDDTGVTFHYDYGFRHVIQALEPDGEYFLNWAEIKPFIKPDGLLGKFIR